MNISDYQAPELPPIAFQWASTITDDLSDLEEIVEDTLTAGGMSVWYGEPNSGKTTMLLDLALRMPSGLPWLGKRLLKGAVIYIALEGPGSIKRRTNAYRKHHGCKVYAFGVVTSSLNLMNPSTDVEDLLALIADLKTELLASEPLRLIVVDTVARAMGGANENASEDMSRLISAGDLIRKETGAHVAFVHHSGKDVSLGARGHSSLKGAVDTEIEITESGKVHTATITKQRDLGTKGMKLSARFRPIELGMNQWGNPITACVVEPIEPLSPHMESVMRSVDNERAEAIAVTGFKRLQEMGVKPTDGPTSRDYLPRQLLDKGLAEGFTREALTGAMDRLMTKGRFKRGVIGHYTNRTEKLGLVLVEGGL